MKSFRKWDEGGGWNMGEYKMIKYGDGAITVEVGQINICTFIEKDMEAVATARLLAASKDLLYAMEFGHQFCRCNSGHQKSEGGYKMTWTKSSGRELAAWRERWHLSQREAAMLLNITQAQLCRLEYGRNQPRPDTLRKIEAALKSTDINERLAKIAESKF